MEAILAPILAIIIFGVIAVLGLLFPEKVQQYYLNYYKNNKPLISFNPFFKWTETDSYIFMLRCMGVVSLFAIIIVIAAMISNLFN